jgi:hypothetical protein
MTTISSTYRYCSSDAIGNTCAQNCCEFDIINSQTTSSCAPQVLCSNSQTYSMNSYSYSCSYDGYGNKCAQNCCMKTTMSGNSATLCTTKSVC